jgi:hypothetical protein
MMRGPRPSYPIELTTAEMEDLRRLVRAHMTGQGLLVQFAQKVGQTTR